MEVSLQGHRIILTSIYKYLEKHLDPSLGTSDHCHKVLKMAPAKGNEKMYFCFCCKICVHCTYVTKDTIFSGGFKGGHGGHGPRHRTFGNPEGAPHLRKN